MPIPQAAAQTATLKSRRLPDDNIVSAGALGCHLVMSHRNVAKLVSTGVLDVRSDGKFD
jgi:hypothetical protein